MKDKDIKIVKKCVNCVRAAKSNLHITKLICDIALMNVEFNDICKNHESSIN